MENNAAKKWLGWRMVVIAAFILVFVGNFWSNATTVANTAMMASENPIVDATTYGFAYSINQTAMAIAGFVLGIICDKFGAKKIYMFGAILSIVSGLLIVRLFTGGAGDSTLYILNYGILGGLIYMCTATIPSTYLTSNWLYAKRGTATSLFNIGTVVAGVITPPVVTALIAKAGNWQVGYNFYAYTAILGLILAFFIVDRPETVGQYPDNNPQFEEMKKTGALPELKGSKVYKNVKPENHKTLVDALKDPMFYLIVAIMICLQGCAVFMMNPGSVMFVKGGLAMEQVSTVLSVRQLFRVIFLLCAAKIMDKIEPVLVVAGCLVFTGIAYAISANPSTMWQCVLFYAAGSIAMSMSIAGSCLITANVFGNTHVGKILGLCSGIFLTIAGFGSTISGKIFANTGSYAGASWLHVGVSVVGVLLCLVAYKMILARKAKAD